MDAVRNQVTYLGHATNLIDLAGLRLLTDPIFGGIMGFGRRHKPFPVPPASLGRLDGILLSHAHYGHLDTTSLRQLDRTLPVIVPPHTAQLVRRLGYRDVRELAWWESTSIGGVSITATPAAHSAGRLPWSRRTGYGGYLLEAGATTVFFAGDTGAGTTRRSASAGTSIWR